MATSSAKTKKPPIAITRTDHEKLSRFVDTLASGAVADELAAELDRARVVADDRHDGTFARIGSTLTYSTDAGERRTVTLVFPGEADIGSGRISILTPIGVALIGLSQGQSINWTARDGRSHLLTVESVEQPNAQATAA